VSNTQDTTSYTLSCGIGSSTPAGTQCNGAIQLGITAGTDFTDADLFALQQALAAAFPAAWGVVLADIAVSKQDQVFTSYTTNMASNPPSFT
jgi:hypothetical protein